MVTTLRMERLADPPTAFSFQWRRAGILCLPAVNLSTRIIALHCSRTPKRTSGLPTSSWVMVCDLFLLSPLLRPWLNRISSVDYDLYVVRTAEPFFISTVGQTSEDNEPIISAILWLPTVKTCFFFLSSSFSHSPSPLPPPGQGPTGDFCR